MKDDGLLEPAVAARLAVARASGNRGFPLRIADLAVGQVGVLEAQVRTVAPARSYNRKRGGEGLLARVTLADASGEVDLVLWDDETRLASDGPLQVGEFIRIQGPTIKAGYRGGIELGLGSAVVTRLTAPTLAVASIEGRLLAVGEVRPIGALPVTRFTCDLLVATASGEARVAVWDDLVQQARALGPGPWVRISGLVANPLLPGWWTADSCTGGRLEPLGDFPATESDDSRASRREAQSVQSSQAAIHK